MKQKYRYGTTKYISLAERFGIHLKLFLFLLVAVLIGFSLFIYDVVANNQSPQTPTSKTTVKNITFEDKFFSTPYFRFTDSAEWKLIDNQSTNGKFVFQKYLNNSELVQHQLFVYINKTPPPLELAASRVLPIEINEPGSGFKVHQVSDHCGKSFKTGELHKVQQRTISGASLLCDPDQGQFRVVLSKAGGDYNLRLKRADGSMANYIIIYQNQKIDPDADTLMRVADSFQST